MGIEKAKFLTFEEWTAQNQDLIEGIEAAKEICPGCDGSGESECPECGHYGTCQECDGTGKIGESVRETYYRLLDEDKKKLESFLQLAS